MKNNNLKFKILLGVFVILVAIISAAVYSYQKTSDNQNKKGKNNNGSLISVEPLSYDFGNVKLGEVVKTGFLIKNLTSQEQEILNVTTSCGCTKAEINKKNLAPGKEAKLKVIFDSGVHGKSGLGENNRIVYLKFKDPKIDEIEIKVRAMVIE